VEEAEFMNISWCSDYREMSSRAASLVVDAIRENPGLLLCAATGSSPEGLYHELREQAGREPDLFAGLRILKLDEWGGVPENHPVSCENYLRTRLVDPLAIPPERYYSFRSDPEDPDLECSRIRNLLEKEGPIDICILGLGRNGHLGLNEPAQQLKPHCHMAGLSAESLRHPMISSLELKPEYGLTLGMQEILDSRQIIMLVSGREKKEVALRFLEEKVSGLLPASFLREHPRTECLIDRTVLE
jgi:galactosamine-6-phosphate isomerase